MAAWDIMPPMSVTVAWMRVKTGAQLGVVMGQTRISPFCTCSSSSTLRTTRAGPSTTPGEPAKPFSSLASSARASGFSQSWIVSVVMPHSMMVKGSVTTSGGTPRAGGGDHSYIF